MNAKKFKVIDGDNMRLLEQFTEDQRDQVTERLNRQYGEVSEDSDGDITVWEDAQ